MFSHHAARSGSIGDLVGEPFGGDRPAATSNGVGALTSVTILAELGDVRRFSNSRAPRPTGSASHIVNHGRYLLSIGRPRGRNRRVPTTPFDAEDRPPSPPDHANRDMTSFVAADCCSQACAWATMRCCASAQPDDCFAPEATPVQDCGATEAATWHSAHRTTPRGCSRGRQNVAGPGRRCKHASDGAPVKGPRRRRAKRGPQAPDLDGRGRRRDHHHESGRESLSSPARKATVRQRLGGGPSRRPGPQRLPRPPTAGSARRPRWS